MSTNTCSWNDHLEWGFGTNAGLTELEEFCMEAWSVYPCLITHDWWFIYDSWLMTHDLSMTNDTFITHPEIFADILPTKLNNERQKVLVLSTWKFRACYFYSRTFSGVQYIHTLQYIIFGHFLFPLKFCK